MKAIQLITNLTRSSSAAYEVANKMVVSGPPASGKTTIIHAMQLALSGEAHEFGARDAAKAKRMVMSLKHPSAANAHSILHFDEGSKAMWKDGKRENCIPPYRFIVPEIYGFMASSPIKFYTFLYQNLLAREVSERLLSTLTQELATFVSRMPQETSYGRFFAAVTMLGSLKREASTKIKNIEIAIDTIDEFDEFSQNRSLLLERRASEVERAAVAKKLLEDATSVMAEACRTSLGPLEETINTYLTKIEGVPDLHVRIEAGKAPAIGRSLHDEVLVPASSGSETARIAAAIGCAVAEIQRESQIAVVLPDRGLTSEVAAGIAKSLDHAPCMVIIQTCECKKALPKGWAHVALSSRES